TSRRAAEASGFRAAGAAKGACSARVLRCRRVMSGPEEDDAALVGTTVGAKYRIDRLIGRGGMGAVYQATNKAIGKRIALKFLDREAARDLDAVLRFQRDAEAASAIESAHI